MGASTLLMRLLGGGGQGARRKERAKALLKHAYYNRRAIRLVLMALCCLLGLVAVWRIGSSSSSPAAAAPPDPVSMARVRAPGAAAPEGAKRKAQAKAAAPAVDAGLRGDEEQEGELLDLVEGDGGDDDDGWPGAGVGLDDDVGDDDDENAKADDDDDDKKKKKETTAQAQQPPASSKSSTAKGGKTAEAAAKAPAEPKADAAAAAAAAAVAAAAAKAEPAPPAEPPLDPEAERRRNHCMAEFGERRYLEEDEYRVPPILYSYPGSGNTWVRLLIDFATGVYTGSILDDQSLVEALPGQGHCDQSVSAIKAHPNHFEPRRLFNLDHDKDLDEEHEHHRRRAAAAKQKAEQKGGKVSEEEESGEEKEEDMEEWEGEEEGEEYPEDEEEEEGSKTKAGPSSFLRQECLKNGNIPGFHRFILLFRNPYDAIWSEYQRKFKKSHHAAMMREDFNHDHFAYWAPKYALRYVMMLNDFHAIEKAAKRKDIFILKYESLKDRSKRMGTLRKLVSFLGLTAPEPQRLGCADILADRPDTHRTAMVKKEDLAAGVVTKEEVYTPDIACMMWLVFGARARKLGYTLPPWVTREECRTMRYDWSLVLPGRIAPRRRKEFGAAGAQQKEGGGGVKEPVEAVATEKK